MNAAAAEWSAERLGNPDGPLVAVFIHGGFWRARYGAEAIAALAGACAADADLGAWVWNIEYPRVGMAGGGWPGTASSVSEAVGAAVAAAAGRPVVLIGHSAGGHLALWAAREHPVSAVVSLAGVTDLEAADRAGLGRGAVRELFGDGGPPTSELLAAASPIRRLPLGVPVLLIHGDADLNVPVQQSRVYAGAAQAAGDAVELRELPGAEHFEVVDPRGRAWPIVRGWLVGLV